MMNARILLAAGVSLAALVPGAAHAQVEDIVVTARKEKETLQEVPISVAAFDQDMIARYDISDLEDIAKRTPNFTFSNNLGMFGGVPVIRGIGAPMVRVAGPLKRSSDDWLGGNGIAGGGGGGGPSALTWIFR